MEEDFNAVKGLLTWKLMKGASSDRKILPHYSILFQSSEFVYRPANCSNMSQFVKKVSSVLNAVCQSMIKKCQSFCMRACVYVEML